MIVFPSFVAHSNSPRYSTIFDTPSSELLFDSSHLLMSIIYFRIRVVFTSGLFFFRFHFRVGNPTANNRPTIGQQSANNQPTINNIDLLLPYATATTGTLDVAPSQTQSFPNNQPFVHNIWDNFLGRFTRFTNCLQSPSFMLILGILRCFVRYYKLVF